MDRGKWHFLPEKPNTSCDVLIRLKYRDFVISATYTDYDNYHHFYLTYYDTGSQRYDTRNLSDDEIECWCGLEELADILDGK